MLPYNIIYIIWLDTHTYKYRIGFVLILNLNRNFNCVDGKEAEGAKEDQEMIRRILPNRGMDQDLGEVILETNEECKDEDMREKVAATKEKLMSYKLIT